MENLVERRCRARVLLVLLSLGACGVAPSTPTDVGGEPVAQDAALPQDDFELQGQGPSIELDDLAIFLEFNATDDDLGVQVFLDAEGWDRIAAHDPGGRRVLSFMAQGEVGALGLTELRFESAEPSPAEVLGSIPAGVYTFTGRAVEGGRLLGEAELSHDLPPAPVFTPADGEVVDPENTVVEWEAIPGIDGYEVIVENEDSGLVLSVHLGPDATSLSVPPEFMEPDGEYKAEVLAIAENGNKTITEHVFTTGG